ncbi:helix-turn-helix domain-containing protein [Nocardiopsis sp. NPDC006832]|uniref:helix-turn-helix domain-containing protein n=1 Tax=Nocardiopsis sp. NPDC006832 TaxID=3157188 RepID=UPI0033DDB03E
MGSTRSNVTAATVGTVIRDERRSQRLTQVQLARRARVSRTFLIALEEGHPRAALGKVLDVFDALGLNPSVDAAPKRVPGPADSRRRESADKVLERSTPTTATASDTGVEQTLALIEKGQQLAGHFPSDQAMDRARRVLEGHTTLTDARAELAAKYNHRDK